MNKHFRLLAAFLIVATLFGGFLGCKQEPEIILDTTAPREITNLVVKASNGNAVLSWTNPTDEDFAGVQVSMNPAAGTLKNAVMLGKDVTRLDVSGLEIGAEYTFTVKTFDKSLNYSEGASAKAIVTDTSDKTAPAKITNLTVVNKDKSVLLTWTDATDEDIFGYEVSWKENVTNRAVAMVSNTVMVAPGTNSCYITNLINGTEYTFTVKTVDTSGNKSEGISKTIAPTAIIDTCADITLVPNTTEKTNQDVTVKVEISAKQQENISKIFWLYGFYYEAGNTWNDVYYNSEMEYAIEEDITESKEFVATESEYYAVMVEYIDGKFDIFFIKIDNIDKKPPETVSNVLAEYSKETDMINITWENPTDEDFVGTEIVYGLSNNEETTTLTFDKDTTETVLENIKTNIEGYYTVKFYTKDELGNTSEYIETIATTIPKITSISIPTAGISFAGNMLPVTIVGENFDSMFLSIDSIGATFQNITVKDSKTITAETECPSIVGTTNITISYGYSSVNTTLKVLEAEKCFSVGDVLLIDGTRIKAENVQYGIPSDKVFAVITSIQYGGSLGKAIGFQARYILTWAPEGSTGNHTNFAGIQTKFSFSSNEGYIFSGDLDGFDNWEYICSIDPEDTKDAATNYPIFNFANTYGTTAGLTDTDYETGWYIPSIAEVYEVYKNKDIIQIPLTAANGFSLTGNDYWSSTQFFDYDSCAYKVDFYNGDVYYYQKQYNSNVFVLQTFNTEQFNNYEYKPEISTVEIPTIGEGFIGEIPVTITGKNINIGPNPQEITISNLSINNVEYISDTKAIAYVMTTGTETDETLVTVSCGTTNTTARLKVVPSEIPYKIGDIILTDGTKVSGADIELYTIDDKNKPIGVVAIVSDEYGVPTTPKMIGLQREFNLAWAKEYTTGFYTCFTETICIPSEQYLDKVSSITFTGDTDGSDNWDYICTLDPEGTADAADNYPIFHFANTYGTSAGFEYPYSTGWYIPSIAEMYKVYQNKDVIQTSLTAARGLDLMEAYWSSSQALGSNYAYMLDFYADYIYDDVMDKHIQTRTFVLHTVSAE